MKGIGLSGKTLRQMLEENEKSYQGSGRYGGLRKHELATRDPLKLEGPCLLENYLPT
jgi:hypothetical protein